MQVNRLLRRGFSAVAAPKKVEYLIVGGGPVGSSVAYHLAKAGAKNITVLEQDLSYRTASAMLSAGGIRQQYSVRENVQIATYGAQFLKHRQELAIDGEVPDVQFHENGYLFLTGEKSKYALLDNFKTQHDAGATWIQLLQQSELREKFPWLKTDDLALGTFGTQNEGYFDPWLFVSAVKKKAQDLGVEYIEARAVGGKVVPNSAQPGTYTVEEVSVVNPKQPNEAPKAIRATHVINAAGAWSGKFVSLLAQSLPNPAVIHPLCVNPRKRCIFSIHCAALQGGPVVPPSNAPLVVDPSGAYFRPEIGRPGHFIFGMSPEESVDADVPEAQQALALQHVDHNLFEDHIWPALFERVPAFENIKVTSSWAGYYDYNSLDQNAIIGPHSELRNLTLVTGFSGHGLMQSPAAGRAVSELLGTGRFQTIDLSRFSFDRIVAKEPIFETGIV